MEHIPNMHGVLLEREWTGYVSGRKISKQLQITLGIHETCENDKTHQMNVNAIWSLHNMRKHYCGSPT